jgi:hypothetical protein
MYSESADNQYKLCIIDVILLLYARNDPTFDGNSDGHS